MKLLSPTRHQGLKVVEEKYWALQLKSIAQEGKTTIDDTDASKYKAVIDRLWNFPPCWFVGPVQRPSLTH